MKPRVCSLLRMQPPIVLNRGLLFASGADVPADGTDGYQTGCLFQHTDGSGGTAAYINEGTVTSCAFTAIESGTYEVTFNVGAFSSVTAGSGIAISSSQTAAARVYADDNGVNIGTSVRGILGRFLLTVDASGSSIRAAMGQLKLATGVDVTTGIYTGVQGYLELAGTHSAQAGSTLSCIDASLEIGTALTVDSGGEACGIHVETTGSGTITDNGTCAGILVDKASGAADWPYGAILKNSLIGLAITGATNVAVDIQTSGVFRMGVQDTGIDVTTTYPFAMEVQCEANADIVAGDTGSSAGFYTRYAIEVAQTSQTNHIAVFAKLRPKHAMADGNHVGVYALVEASSSNCVVSGSATTLTAAGLFVLDLDTNFEITTGHLNGICVDSSVHASATITGTMAGIRIKKSSDKLAWPSGITIEDAACTTGLTIGNCTTQGILLDGTASSAQLKIAGTAILASGEQAIYINCPSETAATNGIWITLKSSVISGDVSGIRSRITTTGASGTVNNRAVWAQSYVGASGFANVVDGVLAEVSVAAGSADTQHVACLRAHFSAGASFVNDATFYVIHGRCQTRSDETFSGNNALLGLENQAVGGNGKKLNAIIEAKYTSLSAGVHAADYFIDGGVAVNLIDTAFLRLPDDGSIAEASAAGTGNADGADFVGFIKVVIGTTDMYIPLLTNVPASIFT